MRLYDFSKGAPSPRKVRVYLAEKGIQVERVEVDIHKRESRTAEFKRKNPLGNVPVLELDDGTCISDSLAICRYFEALQPDPPLFGESPLQQAQIEMWNRRVETNFYFPMDLGGAFDTSAPEAGARLRKAANWFMKFLDGQLAQRDFIATDQLSMPDLLAMVALDYGIAHVGYAMPAELAHLGRWHAAMSSRPSAKA